MIHSLTRNGTKTSAMGGVAKALPPNKWIEIFESSRCSDDPGWVLRAADRYFDGIGRAGMLNDVDDSLFGKAVEQLSVHFMNSSHSVRLVAARLLSRLQRLAENEESSADAQMNLFDVFHEAESVFPLAMDNYRDRLLHLRKLSFDECGQYKPARYADVLALVPLKMLVGQLHVNFALTWDPIVELIESHIRGFGCPEAREKADGFWRLFAGTILRGASDNARSGIVSSSTQGTDEHDAFDELWRPPHLLTADDDRPDPLNFRYLLWRAVEKSAPECVEWKSRHLSYLVLDLAEKELKLFNDDPAKVKWENLLTNNDAVEEQSDGKRNAGLCMKTMVTMLRTYSKFRDIKSVAEETAMKNLYTKLIMHQRSDVQKAALLCLFAYKSKSLSPYKKYFEQLLDDSKFRDALVLFQIDSDGQEQCVVDPKHRPEVIRVLMRLLYGRMLGKAGSTRRKMPIFHFLAGCRESELHEFLSLLLVPVAALLTDHEGTLSEHCRSVAENYDVSESISPRRLLGVFSNLHVVFRKLGHLFGEESKARFWKLIAVSSAIVEKVRSEKQAERIHPRYWRVVRDLHRSLLTLLVDFFACFGDDYNFNSVTHVEELKALFVTTCSQRKLEKFAGGEGVNAASGGLLSLFSCWTQSAKLVSLMVYGSDERSKTPLHACVQLLRHPGCSCAVQNRVLTILKDISAMTTVQNTAGGITDGLKMLKPFVSDILAYMRRKLLDDADGNGGSQPTSQKRSKRGRPGGTLSDLDLQLLSKLATCVTEAEASVSMTALLLPGLGTKKVKSEASEIDTLLSLCRMIKNVQDCSRYHESISRLFSKIKSRASRAILCDLWCAAFVENRRLPEHTDSEWEKWEFMAKIIRDWDSWDKKRIEEPDYGRRASAYGQVKRRIDTGDILANVDFVRLIMHDCAFVALETDDLSLRDNASYALRKLIESIPKALPDTGVVLRLVNSDLLPLLKRGFKSQQETVRLEFVSVLASASRAFPEHPRFLGLDSLAPVGGDPETDLFENLRHIQLHLRGRALRRLSERLEQQGKSEYNSDGAPAKKISSETIYLYFLPVCLPWPYVDAVAKHQSALIEEVVRLLTTYCRYQAPWKRYESLLKYFLNRLQKDVEKQKMTVKLLTALLDGFRYDLTNVNVNDTDRTAIEDVDAEGEDPSVHEQAGEENAKMKRKIFSSLTKFHLPRLQKALNRPLQTEVVHRVMQKAHYDEDERILRVPIALALIKLLKKLPVAVLESTLPGVLYKVCQMLKSRSLSIRELTRKTLCSTAVELGPRYLPFMIREMRSILTRGYQTHVLIFTVHALLNALSEVLVPGDLDPCLVDILEICNEDLFGEASEEKEVAELTKHLKEARAQKTYVTYGVLGRLVGVGCLDKAIEPLKNTLATRHTLKAVSRVSNALRYFAVGLSQNGGVSEEVALVFIHRTLTECLPMLSSTYEKKRNSELEELEKECEAVRQQSCLIIPAEPGRSGATSVTPKSSKRSTLHVLVEFALDALFLALKKAGNDEGSDDGGDMRRKRPTMLDPLVDLLYECSTTAYTKTVAAGLRCLCHLAKWYPNSLRAFDDRGTVKNIVDRLFILFDQYAGLGRAGSATKGGEFAASAEVLAVAFKTMATLIQNVDQCQLSSDQLRLLLHYVDEDLIDRHRQAAAFTLIRAVLARKYQCEKDAGGNDLLTTVVQRVRDMSITSQSEHVRAQCRQLVIKHAINYGLLKGKKSRQLFEYYCAQLAYEYEDGRISALESLNSIFDYVDQTSLNTYASMLYVFLSMRLMKDDSAKCKKMVAVTIKNLIRKTDPNETNALVAMALAWVRDDKILHKYLGAQLVSLFVEAEGPRFHSRLATVLPVLSAELNQLRDQNYIVSGNGSSAAKETGLEELAMDQLLFLLLSAIRMICEQCSSLLRDDADHTERMNVIWDNVKSLLRYPHQSVQLVAGQLFGTLFASYTPQELSSQSSDVVRSREYLMMTANDTADDEVSSRGLLWRELSEMFVGALRLPDCQAELAEQAIKNLVFIARVIVKKNEPRTRGEGQDYDEFDSLQLTRRLIRVCHLETSKTPWNYTKRSCVFKWIAAVASRVDKDHLNKWLSLVLPPLYREMTVQEGGDPEIKQLTSEVCDLLKRTVGVDEYSRHWVLCQRSASEKRTARKRKIAEEAVANPEAGARRKIRKQKKKAESRKRKWVRLSGGIERPKRAKMEQGVGIRIDD